MTGAAGCRCLKVRSRLGQRIGAQKSAVMACLTIVRGDAKLRIDRMPRRPLNKPGRLLTPATGTRPVTGVTGRRRRNMRCRLAWRPGARSGMAGCAGSRRSPEDT